MRKSKRLVLLAFLIVVLVVSCALAVACKNTEKYTVTWTIDNGVDKVTINGTEYTGKVDPIEIDADSTVSFTVTYKTGYEVQTVKAGNKTLKLTNGAYSFEVSGDVKVAITSKRILNSITAEFAKEGAVYYAGQSIPAEDLKVVAHYATGEDEEVTGFLISYKDDAETLALGDTSITVKYGGKEVAVNFAAVKGLITLNLNGGYFSQEELAKLPEGYKVKDDVVTWTFDEAIKAPIDLPTPALLLDKDDPTSALPFDKWSGDASKVKDNQILPTSVSVVAAATYSTQLVDVTEMHFVLDEGIPYLEINGEFVAANSAYLYLYEGNLPPVKYDPHETVTKKADSSDFTLRLNLADLAKATPEYGGEDEYDPSMGELAKSLIGKWLDIRFCVKLGNTTIMQELFLTDDSDFADLDDQVIASVDGKYYRFFFESWTPKAGDFITGGNGAQFEGTEKILKLHYEETDPYMLTGVALENKDGVANLVISATYLAAAENEEAVKAIFQAMYADLENNSDINSMGWYKILNNGGQVVEIVDFNAAGNTTLKIYLSLEAAKDGEVAFSHIGTSSNNLVRAVEETSITIGTVTYTMKNWGAGWSPNLVCVYVTDASAKATTFVGADLKVEGDKVLYVVKGTYKNYTEDELKALAVNFDLQANANINGGSDWERYAKDCTKTITVNEADKTFEITLDITSLINEKKAYTSHLSLTAEAITGDAPDFKPECDSFDKSVEFGDWIVKMSYVKGSGSDKEFWGCVGITVFDKASAFTVNNNAATLEQGADGKVYLVVTGTYLYDGFNNVDTLKAAIIAASCDAEPNGQADNKIDLSAGLTVTVDTAAMTYTAKIDISALEAGQYWMHMGGADVRHTSESCEVTVGNKTYRFIHVDNTTWTAHMLEIVTAE